MTASGLFLALILNSLIESSFRARFYQWRQLFLLSVPAISWILLFAISFWGYSWLSPLIQQLVGVGILLFVFVRPPMPISLWANIAKLMSRPMQSDWLFKAIPIPLSLRHLPKAEQELAIVHRELVAGIVIPCFWLVVFGVPGLFLSLAGRPFRTKEPRIVWLLNWLPLRLWSAFVYLLSPSKQDWRFFGQRLRVTDENTELWLHNNLTLSQVGSTNAVSQLQMFQYLNRARWFWILLVFMALAARLFVK